MEPVPLTSVILGNRSFECYFSMHAALPKHAMCDTLIKLWLCQINWGAHWNTAGTVVKTPVLDALHDHPLVTAGG